MTSLGMDSSAASRMLAAWFFWVQHEAQKSNSDTKRW